MESHWAKAGGANARVRNREKKKVLKLGCILMFNLQVIK